MKKRHYPLFKIPLTQVFVILLLLNSLLCFGISAQDRISISIKDASLEQVLQEIQKKADLRLLYNVTDVRGYTGISIHVANVTIDDVLKECLKNTKLTFSIKDNTILISQEKKQPEVVKGIVKDTKGEPLVGATVVIKNTVMGTATDAKGEFALKLDLSTKPILVFTYMGYVSKEVPVTTSKQIIHVVLQENVAEMNEVVVTGYQTIAKERATGAFSVIDAKKIGNSLQPNLTDILEGLIPGLVINKSGDVEIRGVSTFQAEKTPLIVLDGFPFEGSLNDINPANIQNITVLKDGVAASIYGARSANGVIVITTKAGERDHFSISYRGTFMYKMKSLVEEKLEGSTSDYVDAIIEYFKLKPNINKTYIHNDIWKLLAAAYRAAPDKQNIDYSEAIEQMKPYREVDGYGDTYKYAQRARKTQTHNILINGGNDKNQYNVSLNFVGDYAPTPKDNSQQFKIDIKNTWKANDALSINLFSNVNYNVAKGPVDSWRSLMQLTTPIDGGIFPIDQLFDSKGKSQNITPRAADYYLDAFATRTNMFELEQNPYDDLFRYTKENKSIGVRLGTDIRVKLLDGLSVSGGGAWHITSGKYLTNKSMESFDMRYLVNMATDKTNSAIKYVPVGDMLNEYRSLDINWTLRGQIDYNRSFNDDRHRVNAIAGAEARRIGREKNEYATRLGYNKISGKFKPVNIVDINNGQNSFNKSNMVGGNSVVLGVNEGKITTTENRFASFYGNASYEYANKYLVSGSIRLDLTNFFGTNPKYKYKPLWSVGGTWKLSSENFFNVPVIDMLHLRASYGINGNISLTEGPFMIISYSSVYNSDADVYPTNITSPPNNQLRWEKTTTKNLGVDVAILDSRIKMTFDYYSRKSKDLLSKDEADPTMGFSTLTKNIGTIRNSGIELSLGAQVLNRDFKWNSSVVYSYNKNKVLEYFVKRTSGGSYTGLTGIIEKEHGMGALFSYRSAGLSEQGASLAYNSAGEKVAPNTLKYEDLVFSGLYNSPHSLGFTNTFSYKNAELSFVLYGKFGGKFRRDGFFGNNYTSRFFKDRWQNPGDEATKIYPAFNPSSTEWLDAPYMDFYVTSSDYIRLRNVMLSYTLPKFIMKSTFIGDVKLSCQVRNLFVIRGYNIPIDPETMGYPDRPEFHFGLSISFNNTK